MVQPVVLLAEDDPGHAGLISRNLRRAGVAGTILHFPDGPRILEFLQQRGQPPHRQAGIPYVLLLDLRMPSMDGLEVLRQIKNDPQLQRVPVVVVTTSDDPAEIHRCYALGCNAYVSKSVDYQRFSQAMQRLGSFLSILEIPCLMRS